MSYNKTIGRTRDKKPLEVEDLLKQQFTEVIKELDEAKASELEAETQID